MEREREEYIHDTQWDLRRRLLMLCVCVCLRILDMHFESQIKGRRSKKRKRWTSKSGENRPRTALTPSHAFELPGYSWFFFFLSNRQTRRICIFIHGIFLEITYNTYRRKKALFSNCVVFFFVQRFFLSPPFFLLQQK